LTENHHSVTQEFFLRLLEAGYLTKDSSEQFYDPDAGRFLPDRYVGGTCPHCDYPDARGDQCENCGRTLDATDLINPRSKLTGATPELRKTEHYFMDLPAFAGRLRDWLSTKDTWRKHVKNWALGMVEDMPVRAMTRDIDWGVDVPVDDLGPGKKIYVWFDAVIGYLSASIEWASMTDDPNAWEKWWKDPEAESYYIVGKDNIPFHTVIWPAMLMGHGGLNLPTDVPANQYITFKGQKASKSKGVGNSIGFYAGRLQPDALRYAIAAILPEQNDSDLSDDEIIRRVNEELVATWGNLVNRVLSMSANNFDGAVPEPGDLTKVDQAILDLGPATLDAVADHIEKVELRAGLRTALDAAAEVNAYLNATEPWRVLKEDPVRAGTILWTAIQGPICPSRRRRSESCSVSTPGSTNGQHQRLLAERHSARSSQSSPSWSRTSSTETPIWKPQPVSRGQSSCWSCPDPASCRSWEASRCFPEMWLGPVGLPIVSKTGLATAQITRSADRHPCPWPSRSARRCRRSRRSTR